MNLVVTLSGAFPDNLDNEDLEDLKEQLEDVGRWNYGGSGLVVEVVRT